MNQERCSPSPTASSVSIPAVTTAALLQTSRQICTLRRNRGGQLMATVSRTFRVFVSSTFWDLVEERNALQHKVFPALASLCEKAGSRFQAIDLRWGVSQEAGLDQRTARICLEEIERCQRTTPRPNFIILLGNRYGSRHLPEQILATEFEQIILQAEELQKAEKVQPAQLLLLLKWYQRDDNALPPVYYLRRRERETGADYTSESVWTQDVEVPIRALLTISASAIPLSDEQRAAYEQSLTEREILAGALSPAVPDAKEHVFAYFREVEAFDQLVSAPESEFAELRKFVDLVDANTCDMEARERLRSLKARLEALLGPDHVRRYLATWSDGAVSRGHLDALCENVLADLTAVIQAEITRFAAADSLDTEVAAHMQFGELRGGKQRFVGRENLLSPIAHYLTTADANRPLVIFGPAGAGKSAIIARSADEARDRFPQAVILERFIGATPPSVDGRSLLQSLCEELGRRFQNNTTVPLEYRELVSAFRERLAWATVDRPILVFLDAVDQLSETDNAKSLVWLPRQLPPNVRLVVSVMDDSVAASSNAEDKAQAGSDPLVVLRRRSKPEDLLPVEDYPREDATELLGYWMRADKRTLTPPQSNLILSAFQRCPRPLFLKLAAEEGKQWRSTESAPKMPAADSADAMLSELISQLFDRLSAPSNHGTVLVERALGYLVSAKNGLTEEELIGVLSTDREFFDTFQAGSRSVGQSLPPGVKSLPVAVWVRLYSDLQPYLTTRRADGTTLFAFYHRSLEQAARKRFLSAPDIAGQRHRHLADYFTPKSKDEQGSERFDPLGFFRLTLDEQRAWAKKLPPEPRPVNIRMAVELPYQLLQVAKLLGKDDATSPHWDAVADLLLNIHFLEAKAEAQP
jgi:NACHT domain- and WD repeat-containing protein